MTTNTRQTDMTANASAEQKHMAVRKDVANRLLATNWGLAVIGGLVALAIGVSALHSGYAKSVAQEVPEFEQESAIVLNE